VTNINISTNASNAVTNTPSTSPTTFSAPRPEKRRKSKDESPSPFNGNNIQASAASGNGGNSTVPINSQTAGVKKPKNVTSPCAISPVLLECPEQDCSKKYKHANGLKYHQSHAHGIISNADDDSLTAPDSPSQRSQSPPNANSADTAFPQKMNFESVKSVGDSKVNSSDATSAKAATAGNVERPSSSASAENSSSADPGTTNPFAEAISKPSNPGISTTSTPTKQDAQTKSKFIKQKHKCFYLIYCLFVAKPNILRFANTSDIEQTSNDSMSDLQSQGPSFYSLQGKTSNAGKNKKGRKSPGPDMDTEVCTISKSEGVRSPAYSDISDDSNTATENNLNGKSTFARENFSFLLKSLFSLK
jgi:hypothetical protein